MHINPFIDNPFATRHIGPSTEEISSMLHNLGLESISDLQEKVLPASILNREELKIGDPLKETEALTRLKQYASKNNTFRSFIGMGYYGTVTPAVIQRNILENPGWYTQYTPYQAEISQGRLEALLNFQTMVSDLTGFEIANASLLDEATAAAEAMTMFHRMVKNRNTFLVSEDCHPQIIEVLKTRSNPLGIKLVIANHSAFQFNDQVFGVLVAYPTTDGAIMDYQPLCEVAHSAGAFVAVAVDLLSLTLLKPPGEFGADAAIGNSQRFGVPPGYGGPHAAFIAATEVFKRKLPGRIIGVSVDKFGNPALRMALQTREQHIRRERATSNICTAQVLLAIMASMYAVYHGPKGLRTIATRIHTLTRLLMESIEKAGHSIVHKDFFDTLRIKLNGASVRSIQVKANELKVNLRHYADETIGLSLDEQTSEADLSTLSEIFNTKAPWESIPPEYNGILKRESTYLAHPVFNRYQSETEFLRYVHRLETKDLSLNTSMIPLGSCTMKLNATTEMIPISWDSFNQIHPFVPVDQAAGYQALMDELASWLVNITGLAACSFQPNSGAQGEYTGLMLIRAYHHNNGNPHRNICLIPASAHGTNPASAVMAGMEVVIVQCDQDGNVDLDDLEEKAHTYSDRLGALMITYPSTHGVFEEAIKDICQIIHNHGGQVYLDGANLNALVGLVKLGAIGADVCHINLHKTFAIPHGGGGPGMGPICVAEHLKTYLPKHPLVKTGGLKGISAVAAAPFGSTSILPISWSYIAMLGSRGLKTASLVAILNANYMARRLSKDYPILYLGKSGFVAHEFIIDLRPLKKLTGITEEDVSKRLMDYGFHAPTTSFPVHGTLMIEPTESESKQELDRFCEALIRIKAEIMAIRAGKADPRDNVLKNAPHTAVEIATDRWEHPYTRKEAAYPAPWLKEYKFWPPVSRIDNAYGDRHLICSCPPL
ncbi:MAG: aminomethyl-transferring glycine dehydrogenase, partial [Fidelibacterota bacterium]